MGSYLSSPRILSSLQSLRAEGEAVLDGHIHGAIFLLLRIAFMAAHSAWDGRKTPKWSVSTWDQCKTQR